MKILHNGKEVFVLDLGRVKIGESKQYVFTLENEVKWDCEDIELEVVQLDENDKEVSGSVIEVAFTEYPKELKGYENAPLEFTWTPGIEIKRGLKAKIKVKCLEVWR